MCLFLLMLITPGVCGYSARQGDNKTTPFDPTETNFFFQLTNSVRMPPSQKPLSIAQAMQTYPWLGRVTAVASVDAATLCTATCVARHLFLSSARCLIGLTPAVIGVHYDNHILNTVAIVVTDKEKSSKKYFDEIGIVVTESSGYAGSWPAIHYVGPNRTDRWYQWMIDDTRDSKEDTSYVALGYKDRRGKTELYYVEAFLMVLNCFDVTGIVRMPVPCFLTCNLLQFHYRQNKVEEPDILNKHACLAYLRIDGASLYDTQTNSLVGVATWGRDGVKNGVPLGVGISVPNSDAYHENYACALLIAENASPRPEPGRYQDLCDGVKVR